FPIALAPAARRSRTAASLGSEVGFAAGDLRLVEIVVRGRVHLIALHFLAYRVEADRMRHRDPRCFFLENDLRLLVELGAIGLLGRLRGLDDQILERLVAPARVVAAALDRLAAEQGYEEIVRIAVVSRPAEHDHLMLAALRALAVFGPFISQQLG